MKAAHRNLQLHPGNPDAIQANSTAKQEAETTFRAEKERSWNDFMTSMDPSTPTSAVWRVIRSLDGRKAEPLDDLPLHHGDKTARSDK